MLHIEVAVVQSNSVGRIVPVALVALIALLVRVALSTLVAEVVFVVQTNPNTLVAEAVYVANMYFIIFICLIFYIITRLCLAKSLLSIPQREGWVNQR